MGYNSKKTIITILKTVGIILIILLVVAIISAVWLYNNGDKVKSIVVTELNRSLNTEISVQEIDFTVFKSFPSVSVQFKDVLAKEAYNPTGKADTLFYAGAIAFKFNALDIYRGHYTIRRLDVSDAGFYMKYFTDSLPNYIFWKKSDKPADSTFSFELSKVSMQNVRYIYHNEMTKQHYDILIEKGKANGNFGAEGQVIDLDGDLKINHFQTSDFVLFREMPAKLSLKFEHRSSTKSIHVKQGALELQKLPFSVEGDLCYAKDSSHLNVDIRSKNLALERVIKTLPDKLKKSFDGYKSTGVLDLSMNISGKLTAKRLPLLTAKASIKNGSLSGKNVPLNFKKINLSGSYTNGEQRNMSSSSMVLDHFSVYTDEGFAEGKLHVVNFSNPIIDADFKASIDLAKLQAFLKMEEIEKLNGQLDIDLQLKGNLKDLKKTTAYALNEVNMSGTASVKNANFKLKSYRHTIENLNTILVFDNKTAGFSGTYCKIATSQVSMKGIVQNILPFILLKEQSLQLSAEVALNNLILEDFLSQTETAKNTSKTQSGFALPRNITADLRFSTEKFSYKNMKAENVKTILRLANGNLSVKDLNIASLGGNLSGNLMIESAPENKQLQIAGDVKLNKININSLFKTFDNFEQKVIVAENFEGNVTADINFLTIIGEKGVEMKRLKVLSNTKIENGALLNFKPLNKLSYFVEEDALNNIHFKTLSNTFVVQNETLEIPLMEVQSNAVSFWISGKQKFSGELDYHLKIKFSELSSKKQKARLQREQKEFGTFEEENSGQLVLYIFITGTIDKPIFKYDSKSAKTQFKENLKAEALSLKAILKNEIDPQTEETKREKENLKKQEQGHYIIEWEEKPTQDTIKKKPAKETKFNVEWE